MSALHIEVRVDTAQVQAMLTLLSRRMGNMAPVMRQVGEILRSDALDNFKGQHAPDGTPWKPLSGNTLLGRARRLAGKAGLRKKDGSLRAKSVRTMAGAKILIDTGVLRNSIGAPGAGGINTVTPTSVTIGSRIAYAAIHQFGGRAGRGRKVRIPARPYIGMSQSAERSIIDRINAYIGTVQR